MDRQSEFWHTAKQILNHENQQQYSDIEINEIINFLEVLAEITFQNLIREF